MGLKYTGIMPCVIGYVMLLAIMCGCTPGKHSFLIVQTCLADQKGTDDFVDEMRSIARVENMEFLNSSNEVAQQLENSGSLGRERTHDSKVLDISVQRADGLGVTAVNHGLPGFEVALGFSEGTDAPSAHAFADRVVRTLGRRWKLEIVPAGMGAKPKGDCP
jgi:hypothetical protein